MSSKFEYEISKDEVSIRENWNIYDNSPKGSITVDNAEEAEKLVRILKAWIALVQVI